MMPDPNQPLEPEEVGAHDEGAELQFDEAEPTTATATGATCAGCNRPIESEYYEIGGKLFCPGCRQHVEAAVRGGSGFGRFIVASALGFGAAIVGAAIYYAVTRATGWNIGYVAIVVGFIVGGAVRRGTGNRGGFVYQLLAVLLTYFAIGLMGLTFLIEAQIKEFRERRAQHKAAVVQAEKPNAKNAAAPKAAVPPAKPQDPAKNEAAVAKEAPTKDAAPKAAPLVAKAGDPSAAKPGEDEEEEEAEDEGQLPANVGLAGALVVRLLYIGFVIAAGPVLHAMSAPISGLIYGFALWQAWVMNRRAQIVINGPFQVSKVPEAASHPEEVSDDGR
jgi:hypothetical protein